MNEHVKMNATEIQIDDLQFVRYITAENIDRKINEIARKLQDDLSDKYPMFLVVMNGAFIFAADLMRKLDFPCELNFVRIKSYQGTQSSGNVDIFMPPDIQIRDRYIVIVEDIIDTGLTITSFRKYLQNLHPADIRLTSILIKPEAHLHPVHTDYPGFSIPDLFVVGYGLDYNGKGRNLPDLYQLKA
jgi:hypoxanthine phosphoribosyltransferase